MPVFFVRTKVDVDIDNQIEMIESLGEGENMSEEEIERIKTVMKVNVLQTMTTELKE